VTRYPRLGAQLHFFRGSYQWCQVGIQPVRNDPANRAPERVKVNRFLDVSVCPQFVALVYVPILVRGAEDDYGQGPETSYGCRT
jgi:hypothetical protein